MFCGLRWVPRFGGCTCATGAGDWLAHSGVGGRVPADLLSLVVLPESPRWQVRRQLPQAGDSKNPSAHHPQGFCRYPFLSQLNQPPNCLWDVATDHIDAVVVFFMSLLIFTCYDCKCDATEPSRHRPATAVAGPRRISTGGTLGALALGVLMDKFNPFRVLALSYATGAICIVMIGLSQMRIG